MSSSPMARPVRTIAFAGAGHISAVHALAIAACPDLRVTHVASRSAEHAAERAEQLHAAVCSYAELPAGADAVLVSTPPADHATTAIEALQAGAAVIVEKPLATTLADADRLVDAAAAVGHALGYAENLAYAPIVQRAVASRERVGPVHHLDARVLQSRPHWGDFLTASWGGGVLFDLGVHPIAVILLLTAPARPVAVSAKLAGAHDIDVDEHAELTLSFDTGLHAQLEVSWRQPDPADRVWDLQAASATGVLRLELSPNLGLEVDGSPVVLPAPRAGLPSPQLEQMGYVGQVEAFVDDFGHGRRPLMDAEFGRDVLDIVCAAYESAHHHGRPEPLPFRGPRDRTPLSLWRGH